MMISYNYDIIETMISPRISETVNIIGYQLEGSRWGVGHGHRDGPSASLAATVLIT
jgi:hypothetical protein